MDGIQLLLIIVIVSLTSVLLVIGVQVFFVIREVRRIVKRVQLLLDNPSEKVSSFLASFKKSKE